MESFEAYAKRVKEYFGRLKLSDDARTLYSIFVKHFALLKKEPKRNQELYMRLFPCITIKLGAFNQLISDFLQGNDFWRAVAEHNRHVEKALAKAGINVGVWNSYTGWTRETLVEYDRSKIHELWAELELVMAGFKQFFAGTELYRSICKDIINIQKKRNSILRGMDVPVEAVFPIYNKSLKYLAKRDRLPLVDTEYKHFMHRTHEILHMFNEKWATRHYSVRLWKREPIRDLLQGNFSNCCISIGERGVYPDPGLRLPDVAYRKYPAGILEFLIDKGIQVAEVRDSDNGTIGQCWLFCSPTSDGRANLIADSFDINSGVVTSDGQKAAIRSCMFRFLKKYSEVIGARRSLLGKNGQFMPDNKRRGIMHDVKVEDLPVARLGDEPIEKIGGYFQGQPYFLESRHGNEAYEIVGPA